MSSMTTPRFYFAYGSNLALSQMASRCPTSKYHSLGLLHNYKWVIGPRGYANVVSSPYPSSRQRENQEPERVYGLLYTIEPEDEAFLDHAEGVPFSYIKKELDVEILTPGLEGIVKALVYVDEIRTGTGVCKEEYVARMNRGVKDAVEKGMPAEYVESVLRPWVREEEVPGDVGDPFHPKTWDGREVEGL